MKLSSWVLTGMSIIALPTPVNGAGMNVAVAPMMVNAASDARKGVKLYYRSQQIHVRKTKLSNCDTMTPKQVQDILKDYPNVLVICDKQNSILYPSVLDEDGYKSSKKSNANLFTEVSVSAGRREAPIQIPLLKCLYFPNSGTGAVEVRVTTGGGISGSIDGGVSIPIPSFGISAQVGTGAGVSGSVYVDHACNTNLSGVRPMLTLSTFNTTVKTRNWVLSDKNRKAVQKGKWQQQELTLLTGNAPMVSCVSEDYVSGVCEWTEQSIKKEIGQTIRIGNAAPNSNAL